MAAARDSLATLVDELTPLDEATATARTAKSDAVAAVVAADADLAANLALDDAAQGLLLTYKTTLDNATYEETAA